MNIEEMMEIWHKAWPDKGSFVRVSGQDLERFFQAAYDAGASAERNSWPAEMEAMERQVNILTDALAQAKAEEREKWMERTAILIRGERDACASVCENAPDPDGRDLAERIRARSNT